MIDTSVLLTDIIVDNPLTEVATGTPQADNSSSSFSPDDTNMGYFWAIPSNAFGLIPSGIFQASVDVVDTRDNNDSIQQMDVFGASFGGISDPGSQLGLGLTNTLINPSTWIFQASVDVVDTRDNNDSIQQMDVFGASFGGISDPGAQLGLGLINTLINTSTWSDANALTFASTTMSVQYWS